MSQNVLRLDNITMQFGGVVAVDNLSLEVNEGEIVALIGPNGAGKTTAFNTITGVYEPTNGQVSFMGEPIVRNHPQGKMKKQGENQGQGGREIRSDARARPYARPDHQARHGAHVPEHPSVEVPDRVRQCAHRQAHAAHQQRLFRYVPSQPQGGGAASRGGHGASAHRGPGGCEGRAGDVFALRQAAPAGDRPRAGDASEAPDARRACCRHESAGDERADRVHRPHPRRVPHDHSAH